MSKEHKKEQENEKTSIIKNLFLIIIFLGIGIFAGSYITDKYLSSTDDEPGTSNTDEWPIEITGKSEYKQQIDELYSIVNGNSMFYVSTGLSYKLMDTTLKLSYIYNNLVGNNIGETDTIASLYYASPTCNYNFLTDPGETAYMLTNQCTIVRISKNEFTRVAKTLFNDSELDTTVTFSPIDGKSCVAEEDNYICGNVNKITGITGDLESKFDIVKVTLDKDNTIKIYDKGYLVDKRSNVINPDDGFDNYYLHSADSNQYYYELKSADNLTFIHIFNKGDNGKYYYVSTILDKKE